jgi:hypothetical protein
MRNNKNITEPKIGMRIKMALPTTWCQVHSDSPYQWLKGKIIEIPNENCIIVHIWSKRVGRIDRMQCSRKDGEYQKIIKQK